MYSAIAGFIIAFAVSLGLTPAVREAARRAGAVDAPGARRVQRHNVPRMGGVAVFVAFFVPLFLLFMVETSAARIFFSQPLRIVGLGLGGLLVCGLGVLDDVRGVRAWHKLAVQLFAATIAFACGFRIDAVTVPFFGVLDMGVFALPVTAIWIVGIVNAVNLIDGLDGLAGGIAFFAAVANFVVGYLTGNGLVMLTSATLGGAIIGFLRYNFNPATIFMGDSGSMFLGYVLATSSLLGAAVKSSTTVAILVPMLAMGLPIMDMLLVMVRRYLERRPIFSPDRGHLHHRLLDVGITHRRAVLTLYAISLLGCASAIGLAAGRSWEVGGALVLMSLVVAGLFQSIRYFDQLQLSRKQRNRYYAQTTSRLRRYVPETLVRIGQTNTLAELARELERFAGVVGMKACALAASELPNSCSVAWDRPSTHHRLRKEDHPVDMEYPLQSVSSGRLRFILESPEGSALPQDDILLQLIADAVDARVAALALTSSDGAVAEGQGRAGSRESPAHEAPAQAGAKLAPRST